MDNNCHVLWNKGTARSFVIYIIDFNPLSFVSHLVDQVKVFY